MKLSVGGVEHLAYRKMTKGERVKEIISRHLGKITKREILTVVPDISEAMVEKALADLMAEGFIEKVGIGRGSGYRVVASAILRHRHSCDDKRLYFKEISE